MTSSFLARFPLITFPPSATLVIGGPIIMRCKVPSSPKKKVHSEQRMKGGLVCDVAQASYRNRKTNRHAEVTDDS